jgi:ABC-type branched-subunit amino acid transport system substrate-binding protein
MGKYFLGFIFMALVVSCINKPNEKIIVSFTSDEVTIVNEIIETINKENKIVIINENLEITYTTQDYNRNGTYNYLINSQYIGNELLDYIIKNGIEKYLCIWGKKNSA